MDRRVFLSSAALVILRAPLATEAQQAGKTLKIGYLSTTAARDPMDIRFVQALRDLGWVEGQNIVIESHFVAGKMEQLAASATALVRMRVDVIVALSPPGVAAARQATSTIPIVGVAMADPITPGWIKSYARPGGNVTGLANPLWEITGKWFELLKQALPRVTRVATIANPTHPSIADYVRETETAARSLGVEVKLFHVSSPENFESTFSDITGWRADGLLVLPHPMFLAFRAQIVKLAARNRLPGVYWSKEYAELGGLLAYAPSLVDMAGRAAVYVDKILRGAAPADLPVERPTTFELVINMKTAKALGLTIPPSLLLRADQIIE